MKRSFLFLILILSGHSFAKESQLRTQGLIYAGLLIMGTGAYQLVKKSETKLATCVDIISGLGLISCGLALILLSQQLVAETNIIFNVQNPS